MIDHLFRHESGKMVSILSRLFGFDKMEVAQDLVQDTFLLAYENWKLKGIPDNPAAWLQTVAKNKAYDYIRRHQNFQKIASQLKADLPIDYSITAQIEIAFQQFEDSQLQMIFTLCHPAIPAESQVALALRTLCGFSIEEIAKAFLTNKETINKRLYRAKEKIRSENLQMHMPSSTELNGRLESVLQTIYLLFNEGYYSSSQEVIVRKELCLEAMRLCLLLVNHKMTNLPYVNALMAIMCFHVSRFESRLVNGEVLSWHEQNRSLWDKDLINKGNYFLIQATKGEEMTQYHLEAMIAYYHTIEDSEEKWKGILSAYDLLVQYNPTPFTFLNRAYAISNAHSPQAAVNEVLKIKGLESNHLYFAMLGELYQEFNKSEALQYWQKALNLAPLESEKALIQKKINALSI